MLDGLPQPALSRRLEVTPGDRGSLENGTAAYRRQAAALQRKGAALGPRPERVVATQLRSAHLPHFPSQFRKIEEANA